EPSELAAARVLPSGEKARPNTHGSVSNWRWTFPSASWTRASSRTRPFPSRRRSSRPVVASHRRTGWAGLAGGGGPAVRAEGDGPDRLRVTAGGSRFVAGGDLPQPHRGVAGACRQEPAVGGEGQRGAGVVVVAAAPQAPQLLAGGDVAEVYRAVQ